LGANPNAIPIDILQPHQPDQIYANTTGSVSKQTEPLNSNEGIFMQDEWYGLKIYALLILGLTLLGFFIRL